MTFLHTKCISAIQTEKIHKNQKQIQQEYTMKRLAWGFQSE